MQNGVPWERQQMAEKMYAIVRKPKGNESQLRRIPGALFTPEGAAVPVASMAEAQSRFGEVAALVTGPEKARQKLRELART